MPPDEIQLSDQLVEQFFGDWEGKERSLPEIQEAVRQRMIDGLLLRPPGGESVPVVAKRMRAWIDSIHDMYPDGKIAIFSHRNALCSLFYDILGFDSSQLYRMHLHNTSISRFSFENGNWTLISLNDYAHLHDADLLPTYAD